MENLDTIWRGMVLSRGHILSENEHSGKYVWTSVLSDPDLQQLLWNFTHWNTPGSFCKCIFGENNLAVDGHNRDFSVESIKTSERTAVFNFSIRNLANTVRLLCCKEHLSSFERILCWGYRSLYTKDRLLDHLCVDTVPWGNLEAPTNLMCVSLGW